MRWSAIVGAIFIFAASVAHAQQAGWYCPYSGSYYPQVTSCPYGGWVRSAPQPGVAHPGDTGASMPPIPDEPHTDNAAPELGDGMDEFCSQATTPRSIALCSDPELRRLALQRQKAFDTTRARLTPDQRKALAEDQEQWVSSYAVTCQLNTDKPVPLAPSVKNCMAGAGRDRISYIKNFPASKEQKEKDEAVAAAAAKAKQEADDRAAKAKADEEDRIRLAALEERDRKAKERRQILERYPDMGIKLFKLDGKALANNDARLSLTGTYYKNQVGGEFLAEGDVGDLSVGLLTENADRDTRLKLLNCQENPIGPYGALRGCRSLTLLGHAAICEHTSAGNKVGEEPCLAVESSLDGP